jgi:hypothetical protein
MSNIKIRLSQSWQIPQKVGKDGKQYPPVLEKLEIEIDTTLDKLGATYTQLNAEMFNARVNHMKSIKQRSPVENAINDIANQRW